MGKMSKSCMIGQNSWYPDEEKPGGPGSGLEMMMMRCCGIVMIHIEQMFRVRWFHTKQLRASHTHLCVQLCLGHQAPLPLTHTHRVQTMVKNIIHCMRIGGFSPTHRPNSHTLNWMIVHRTKFGKIQGWCPPSRLAPPVGNWSLNLWTVVLSRCKIFKHPVQS